MLHSITNDDILTMGIDSIYPTKLMINIDNSKKNSKFKCNYNVLDLNELNGTLADISYDHVITIPSKYFQDICKQMKTFGVETLDITQNKNELIFSSKNDMSDQEITIDCIDTSYTTNEMFITQHGADKKTQKETQENETQENEEDETGAGLHNATQEEDQEESTKSAFWEKSDVKRMSHDKNQECFINKGNKDIIYQGTFNLGRLLDFAKCSNISTSVQLCMKNNNPLCFKYDVADLGEIVLGIAPRKDE